MLGPPDITPPPTEGIVDRPRLFALIDKGLPGGAACWIRGPAGAGKTSLAASWLRARRRRAVWLRLDEADAEPSAFLAHLERAAAAAPTTGGRRALSGEGCLHTGLRRLLAGPLARLDLCLDDLPDRATPLDAVLRAIVEELPAGRVALFTCRAAPPDALARSIATGALGVIPEAALALTGAEARAVARRRAPELPLAVHEAAVTASRGWAAGLVLALLPQAAPAGVAGFLSAEVLDRLDARSRRLLLEAALLRLPTELLLEQATGVPGAGSVLAESARAGRFTSLVAGSRGRYRFHPAFHALLMERGQVELNPGRADQVRRAAAHQLVRQGGAAIEQAVALLSAAGAFEEMAQLVAREAPVLLEDGRWRTLERWLAAIPAEQRLASPLLELWSGAAAAHRDPVRARPRLEGALATFRDAGDETGAWQAWATLVETTSSAAGDLAPLVALLREHDRLVRELPIPGEPLLDRVAIAALAAAARVWPDHPGVPVWAERALHGVAHGRAAERLASGVQLLRMESWVGAGRWLDQELVRMLDALAAQGATPTGARQRWLAERAAAQQQAGEAREAARLASAALGFRERHLVPAARFLALTQAYLSTLALDPDRAGGRAREVEQALLPGAEADRAIVRWVQGLDALRRGEPLLAARRAAEAVAAGRSTGDLVARARGGLLLAMAHGRLGDPAGAREALSEPWALARRIGCPWLLRLCALVESDLHFAAGRGEAGRASLAEGLALVRETGIRALHGLAPEELGRLCSKALDHGIETDTARLLIESHRLAAPADGSAGEAWPWPLRVRALGRFEVVREGLRIETRARRPLDVLRVLVARGGREVPEHVVTEALWPDADGDLAQHALETALYRLRRLVGQDVVLQQDRALTLRRDRCWVDSLELEERLGAALASRDRDARSGEAVALETRRIAELYRGPLLAEARTEGWASEARDRLRRKLARWMERLDHQADPALLAALQERVAGSA